MFNLPGETSVYLAEHPADLRRSFDGLAAIVEGQFGMSVISGSVFVFLNRRGNQARLLFWERNGLCILAKRLDSGVFRRVKSSSGQQECVEIDGGQLAALLEGVPSRRPRRRTKTERFAA